MVKWRGGSLVSEEPFEIIPALECLHPGFFLCELNSLLVCHCRKVFCYVKMNIILIHLTNILFRNMEKTQLKELKIVKTWVGEKWGRGLLFFFIVSFIELFFLKNYIQV